MVPHAPETLDPEARTRVAGCVPALDEFLKRGIVAGNVDLDRDELVAALAVLRSEAAALQPQHLSGSGALRNGEHNWAVRRRNFHLGAENGFLQRHRQLETNVGPVARVEAVRCNLDGDDCVAATARPLLPLAGEAYPGPVLKPFRKFKVDRFSVRKGDALRLKRHRILERNLEPISDVGALLRGARALSEAAERAAAAAARARCSAEQALEQVAEVGRI